MRMYVWDEMLPFDAKARTQQKKGSESNRGAAQKRPGPAVRLDRRSVELLRAALGSSLPDPLDAAQLEPLVQQMLNSFLNEQLLTSPVLQELFGGRRRALLRNSTISVHLDSIERVTDAASAHES